MQRIGVLVVSYGSREASMIDALKRSREYTTEVYVADKQRNPFNMKRATKHVVIPDLNVEKITKFVEANKDSIDFGIVGPEKPIIEGIRDSIEKSTNVPMICPTKEYAIEGSKIQTRKLLQEVAPEVNPRFRIFDPQRVGDTANVRQAVYDWLGELHNLAVVKPDKPAAGKGVGVWGDHFTTREALFEHFMSNYAHGPVIIEEKLEGEESSFQAFSDGKHLVPLPDTRDYKRAFEGDKGANTGGMGSYKDVDDVLPFLTKKDRSDEVAIAQRIFERLRIQSDTALRGVPLYLAFMHTAEGPKILENNSRPGDPEIINILPVLKDDFVDLCHRIVDGNLTRVNLEKAATVVTYKVPPQYGDHALAFPDAVSAGEIEKPIDMKRTFEMSQKYGDNLRIYPGAIEQRDGELYALKSRAVCAVGVGETLEEARKISLKGLEAIKGGGLWYRKDIASAGNIEQSIEHMRKLRHKQ